MGKEKEIGIDHIYVVHAPIGYKKHEEHLRIVLKQNYNFDYQFIDKDNDELISQYFVSDIRNTMSKGAMMCTLNHIVFYEQIIKNNDKYALILEDDPYFIGNLRHKLEKVIKKANELEGGFIISLENSILEFPSRKVLKKNKLLYESDHGRCAGAYIIDQKAAQNILASLKIKKCDIVIDFWHNELIRNGIVKMYWADPPFVEQGSLNGKLSSVKSTRTQGIIRRIKWLAQKYYKSYIYRYFK